MPPNQEFSKMFLSTTKPLVRLRKHGTYYKNLTNILCWALLVINFIEVNVYNTVANLFLKSCNYLIVMFNLLME